MIERFVITSRRGEHAITTSNPETAEYWRERLGGQVIDSEKEGDAS